MASQFHFPFSFFAPQLGAPPGLYYPPLAKVGARLYRWVPAHGAWTLTTPTVAGQSVEDYQQACARIAQIASLDPGALLYAELYVDEGAGWKLNRKQSLGVFVAKDGAPFCVPEAYESQVRRGPSVGAYAPSAPVPAVKWSGPAKHASGAWVWTRTGDPGAVYARSSSPPGAIGVPWWTSQAGFYPPQSVGWWRLGPGAASWDLVCWAAPGHRAWTCPNTSTPVPPPVAPSGQNFSVGALLPSDSVNSYLVALEIWNTREWTTVAKIWMPVYGNDIVELQHICPVVRSLRLPANARFRWHQLTGPQTGHVSLGDRHVWELLDACNRWVPTNVAPYYGRA